MNRISFNFKNTTTVITGGSSGIGLASAELIAGSGGDVIVSASRNPEKTKLALSKIRSASIAYGRTDALIEALDYEADDEDSVREFFEKVKGFGRRVDYLIHSPGISPDTPYSEQDAKLWNRVLSVNTTGTHLASKYIRDIMREQEIIDRVRGRIVLVTSTNGVDSYGIFSAAYDASKAATNNMVRNFGEDFHKEDHIVVNGLAPGWIDTELNNTLPPEEREKEMAKIWCQRFADTEEMAINAAALLTLPYYSGRVHMADGGYR
jgi:NAD(P)-dependent dehydrogenase (short-subunit alcohol dehydrogenase family)